MVFARIGAQLVEQKSYIVYYAIAKENLESRNRF